MSNPFALPRLIDATALATLSLALAALTLPALAAGAEPPSLSISPVLFGSTTIQTESAPVEVDVVNEGGEEAITESPYIEGPAEGEFKIVNNGCAKVQPGEHCTIKVSFAPGAESGEKEATLVLPSSNAPAVSTPLQATAVVAILTFEPEPADFGLVRTHENSSQMVGVLNSGEGSVHIDFFGFGGPDSGSFTNGNNNCGGAWLAPGQSCFIQVYFNPNEMRDYEAFLEVHAGPQTFDLDLGGTGGSPFLAPETNPIDLGAATVGAKGVVNSITLTNVGNMEGGYFIAVIAGGSSSSFQLVEENCTGVMIAPNATCTAKVRFSPQSVGPQVARLALFGDGDGGTMIELHGEGLSPAVTLVPGSFDFGSAAVGSRTSARAFAVRNEGTGPLELGAVSIVGTDLGQFALTGDECTDAVLAPGAECQMQVRFAPDSAGSKSARLRVPGPGTPYTAALTGTGKASGGAKPKHRRARHLRFARNTTLVASKAVR